MKGREIKGLWVFVPKNKAGNLSQNNSIKNEGKTGGEHNSFSLKCLGRIEDMVFNCFGDIEGFLVATNGIWKSVRFLPVTEIARMDEDFFLCERWAILGKNQKGYAFSWL